jgi:hypothetical protein
VGWLRLARASEAWCGPRLVVRIESSDTSVLPPSRAANAWLTRPGKRAACACPTASVAYRHPWPGRRMNVTGARVRCRTTCSDVSMCRSTPAHAVRRRRNRLRDSATARGLCRPDHVGVCVGMCAWEPSLKGNSATWQRTCPGWGSCTVWVSQCARRPVCVSVGRARSWWRSQHGEGTQGTSLSSGAGFTAIKAIGHGAGGGRGSADSGRFGPRGQVSESGRAGEHMGVVEWLLCAGCLWVGYECRLHSSKSRML